MSPPREGTSARPTGVVESSSGVVTVPRREVQRTHVSNGWLVARRPRWSPRDHVCRASRRTFRKTSQNPARNRGDRRLMALAHPLQSEGGYCGNYLLDALT